MFIYIATDEALRDKKESGYYLVRCRQAFKKWNGLFFDGTEKSVNNFFYGNKALKADIFCLATAALSDCVLPPEVMKAYVAAIQIDTALMTQRKVPKYILPQTMNKGGRPKNSKAQENKMKIDLAIEQGWAKNAASACRLLESQQCMTAKQLESQYRRTK